MRRVVTAACTIALVFSAVGPSSAIALTKARAERAVVKRVKARYFPKSAYAECHRLSAKLFGCSYTYFPINTSECKGGAKVREYPSGLAVTLGKPHAVIDNGGC